MAALVRTWSRSVGSALRRSLPDERGTTATNLLSEAALGALALVAIGTLLQTLGVDFLDEIQQQVAKL